MNIYAEDNITITSTKAVNDKAVEAKTTADQAKAIADNTAQYFWFTDTGNDTGAHITEIPQDDFVADPSNGGSNLLARSNGIAVRDGTTELATFGASGATIGETTKTHLELDYHSIQGIDKNGNVYFYVSDLRDANGNYTATQKFKGDGVTTQFYTQLAPITSPTVTINGVTTTAYTIGSGIYNNRITFTTAPSDGAEIIITFTTSDADAKAFSLGQRRSGSTVGASSVAMGTTNEASGFASVAEGGNNKAKGDYSHAQGYLCEANGEASHAGGQYSVADGEDSFAHGDHTKTEYRAQTALGRYNDCEPNLAFMVGGGSSDNARKNLLGLEDSAFGGNLRLKGDVYVGCNDDSSGGTKLTAGGGSVTFYGTSSESASTVAKTVTVDNSFALATGVEVSVKFTNTNSASNPTLNVNGTGAIAMKRYGTTAPSTSSASSWMAGSVITFTYDGTYWMMHDWLNTVTGVKGNAESSYRTGSVNITSANLGINDYVTEQGTSGSWNYRKWSSGKVEAWYTGSMSFGATTKATNVYYADGTLAIPSGIFASAPTCIAVPKSASGGAINSAVFSLLMLGSSATSITTRAFRVSANTSSNWALNGTVYAWTD